MASCGPGRASSHNLLTTKAKLVPGNRVLMRMPNNPWLVASGSPSSRSGAVAVTSMPALRRGRIPYGQRNRARSRPASWIIASSTSGRWRASADCAVIGGDHDLTATLDAYPAEFAAVDTAADDVAMLAFTSGATGRPKATMHFHRDLLAMCGHVLCARPEADARRPLRRLAADRLHVRARRARAFPDAGRCRGCCWWSARRRTHSWRRSANTARPCCSPRQRPTGRCSEVPDADFASLRRCVSAGEPLSLATWQAFFDRTGCQIIDGIGSTEMLHIFVSSADDDIRPGATGRLVPGYEACILDDDGTRCRTARWVGSPYVGRPAAAT